MSEARKEAVVVNEGRKAVLIKPHNIKGKRIRASFLKKGTKTWDYSYCTLSRKLGG